MYIWSCDIWVTYAQLYLRVTLCIEFHYIQLYIKTIFCRGRFPLLDSFARHYISCPPVINPHRAIIKLHWRLSMVEIVNNLPLTSMAPLHRRPVLWRFEHFYFHFNTVQRPCANPHAITITTRITDYLSTQCEMYFSWWTIQGISILAWQSYIKRSYLYNTKYAYSITTIY